MQHSIVVSQHLSFLDFFVFFFILLLTYVIVFLNYKRHQSNDPKESMLDYLILGRHLTLPLFVTTLVATWYGGIFGVTEIAFSEGIYNFLIQGLFWYGVYILFAIFLVDRIREQKSITLPELVGKLFGPKSKFLASILNVLNVIPVAYVISVGLLIEILFGIPWSYGMVIGSFIVITYCLMGGFRADVTSDALQFFVMCSSVAIVLFFSISHFGGLLFLVTHLPASHFNLLGKYSWLETMVWGFIALRVLVDPNFYQRCFAANSAKTAKKGILISTLIWCLFDICTTFGALYARAVIPEAEPKTSYLTYAIQLLPDGLRGFFLAGILATIISTLDSYLFVAATTIQFDLLPKKYHWNKKMHVLAMFFIAGFAIMLGLFFTGSIKATWKTFGSFSSGVLLIPMMSALFTRQKFSDKDFIFSAIYCILGMSAWRLYPREGVWLLIDPLYIGLMGSCLGLYQTNFIVWKQKIFLRK